MLYLSLRCAMLCVKRLGTQLTLDYRTKYGSQPIHAVADQITLSCQKHETCWTGPMLIES